MYDISHTVVFHPSSEEKDDALTMRNIVGTISSYF